MAVIQERKKESLVLKEVAKVTKKKAIVKAITPKDVPVPEVALTNGSAVRSEMKDAASSPQKLRLAADLVRGMNAVKSLDVLAFTNKKSTQIIRKVVVSAIANAENNFKMNKNDLVISRIFIDEGVKFPRYRIVSRGRGHRYVRRRSRVVVELSNKSTR